MGYGVRYTTKTKIPLLLKYTCSKCGHHNEVMQTITETAYGQSQSFSQKKHDQVQQNVSEKSKELVNNRILRIIEESKKRQYRTAGFTARCSNCKHREYWARLGYRYIESLASSIAIYPLIIVCGFSLLNDDKSLFIKIVGITAGIVACWYIFKSIHRFFVEKKIRNLPETAFPDIFLVQKKESPVDKFLKH